MKKFCENKLFISGVNNICINTSDTKCGSCLAEQIRITSDALIQMLFLRLVGGLGESIHS